MTHNDIQIGNQIRVADEALIITDILDGYRGVGVTRSGDIHSRDRWFIDIDEIDAVEA